MKDNFKTLETQNRILLEQKECYENILKINEKDIKSREELISHINHSNSELEYEIALRGKYLSFDKYVWIITIFFVLLFFVLKFLDSKIDKLKSEENENKKNQLL